jgi:hypothetical protein
VESERRVLIAALLLVLGGRDTAEDLTHGQAPRRLLGPDRIAVTQC